MRRRVKISEGCLRCIACGLTFLFLSACLSNLLAQSLPNPIPLINQPLVPSQALPGSSAFMLTINGTGFVSSSVVNWNGSSRTTTFVSASQLTAAIPASDIANSETASVTVTNPAPGGGTSDAMYFVVASPASTLTFATLDSYAYSGPLVAADFNGDGKLDLANIGLVGNSSAFCVQLGNGDGSFQAPICQAASIVESQYMIAADFNGDGKPDLAAVDIDAVLHVWLGNGDGTFQQQEDITDGPNGSNGWWLAAADFNHDGKIDLAIATAPLEGGSQGSIAILIGNGDGTFQPVVNYALGVANILGVAVGDFNQDGNLDVVATGQFQSGSSMILLGNGDGTFQSPQALATLPEIAWQVIAADVNGDGKLDLIETDPSNAKVFVMLGKGDGTFQAPVGYSFSAQGFPFGAQLADINADGKLDLVVATRFSPAGVNILLGNGDGTFQSSLYFPVDIEPNWFLAGDFNGDGRADFAIMPQASQYGSQNLSVLLQGTWPAFQATPASLTFSTQAVGAVSSPQTVTLTDTGNTALAISSIGIAGANPSEFQETNTCGSSLAVNASCEVSVKFAPALAGNFSATLSVRDNAPGSPQIVSLAGGTPTAPALTITPSSLTFPSQYVGTSGLPKNVTLTNTGTGALNITSVSTSTSDFGQLSGCGNSLAAGNSCQIGVFFDPTTSGSRSGNLVIVDNASNSPQAVVLSGLGEDFSLAAAQSTQTINPGQTASYTLTLTPAGGFSQTVALSCSGGPAQSTCAVSPSAVTLNGSNTANVSLTVSTTSSSLGPPLQGSPDSRPVNVLLPIVVGFIALIMLGSKSRRGNARNRNLLVYSSIFLLVFLALGMSSCGGGSNKSGVTGGTYPVTVTGSFTSGSENLSHSVSISVVLQ